MLFSFCISRRCPFFTPGPCHQMPVLHIKQHSIYRQELLPVPLCSPSPYLANHWSLLSLLFFSVPFLCPGAGHASSHPSMPPNCVLQSVSTGRVPGEGEASRCICLWGAVWLLSSSTCHPGIGLSIPLSSSAVCPLVSVWV